LTFRDLNRVEKIAKLPRPLTTEGVPDGDDPEIADLGYYAPTQELFCTTAMSAIGTASCVSAGSTVTNCRWWQVNQKIST
jgi:hypothetical protein